MMELAQKTMEKHQGLRVREIVRDSGMTLTELAERSGLSYGIVRMIASNQGNPRLSTLRSLAAALGVSVDDLYN